MSGRVLVSMLTQTLPVIFRYGSRDEQQCVCLWLGKVTEDDDTQDQLRDMQAGWVIGQLMRGKEKPRKSKTPKKVSREDVRLSFFPRTDANTIGLEDTSLAIAAQTGQYCTRQQKTPDARQPFGGNW